MNDDPNQPSQEPGAPVGVKLLLFAVVGAGFAVTAAIFFATGKNQDRTKAQERERIASEARKEEAAILLRDRSPPSSSAPSTPLESKPAEAGREDPSSAAPPAAPAREQDPFERAVRLQDEGRHAEAIPLYREAIRRSPDDLDARFNLGTALEAEGETEEALAAYLAILEKDRANAEAALAAAESADALERSAQALELYRAYLQRVDRDTGPVRRRVETLERRQPATEPPSDLDDLIDDVFGGE